MKRGEVWNVRGFRPCVIVSPDSMNQSLQTVIVVPLTTQSRNWPTRVEINFGQRTGQAICEQIRTISKSRLSEKQGELKMSELLQIKLVLKQMLFD
jgi:mRNA interferase MazF